MLRRFAVLAAVTLLATPSARAEIQKKGPEVWPGRHEISLHIGGQASLNNDYVVYGVAGAVVGGGSPSGFHLVFDYAYRMSNPGTYSIWFDIGLASTIGGCSVGIAGPVGFHSYNYACAGKTFEPGAGIKIKWRTPIPLVPYFKGTAAFVGVFDRFCDDNGFGIVVKPAGGVKYFLTQHIGVGIETGFAFGPVWYSGSAGNARCGDPAFVGVASHGELYAAFEFNVGGEFVF